MPVEEEMKRTRKVLLGAMTFGVILMPLVMFTATVVYMYRETADIRALASTNAANIAQNTKTLDVLREQIIRVEEEQKKRTGRVGLVDDLQRRVEQLERER